MKIVRILAALVLGTAGWSIASAATTTWTMASGYPENSFLTQNIRIFIEEVKKASDGRLEIDLRPDSTLIKHDAIKRAVQSGQVPIGEIRLGVYGNESPMYILDSVPNLAKDYDEARMLMESQKPFFAKLFGKNGMRIITYVAWPGQGFYTRMPIDSPDDFQGKKLRIYSQATQKMGDLLGFRSIILPFAEVSQAFATGMIDSLFTSAQTGTDTQVWDNSKYFTYTGTMHNKNAIIVNERALRALDKDLQKIVIEAGERATRRGWEMSAKSNQDRVEVLRSHGIVVTEASPAIQEALQKVGQTMIEDWRQTASPEEREVLDSYLKTRGQSGEGDKAKPAGS